MAIDVEQWAAQSSAHAVKPARTSAETRPFTPRSVNAIDVDVDPVRRRGGADVGFPPTAKPRVIELGTSTAQIIGISQQTPGWTSSPFDAEPYIAPRDYIAPADADKALREMLEGVVDVEPGEIGEQDLPAELKIKLLPHQVTGIRWLISREQGKQRGGILADDMGLGKTVQMIGLILANQPRQSSGGTLIVMPLALLEQWQQELQEKTTADLRILVHHGSNRTKSPDILRKFDIVLTTYDVVRSEWADPTPPKPKKISEDTLAANSGGLGSEGEAAKPSRSRKKEDGPLFNVEWRRIVLDEAHYIKNRATMGCKACFGLKGGLRWCLTGTPIHNSIDDLFSLFRFLQAQPFNDWTEFRIKIKHPMSNGRAKVSMTRLHVVLKAIMLRRTKFQLIDGKPIIKLTARRVHMLKMDFSDPEERALYDAVDQRVQLRLNKFIKEGSVMQNYVHILVLLLRLRQVCDHASLITSTDATDLWNRDDLKTQGENAITNADDLANALSTLGMTQKDCILCQEPLAGDSVDYCASCRAEVDVASVVAASTKMRRTLQLLQEIKESDPQRKTIIFSQFVAYLELLQPYLKRNGFRSVLYTGKMTIQEREEALLKIKTRQKYTVILISLKAGGVGLNLTCCSRVIISDPWWSPSAEDQGIDRAHRMGNREDVEVYRLAIQNTVEDKLLDIQEKKREIAKAALSGEAVKRLNKLSYRELLHLFNRGDDDTHG